MCKNAIGAGRLAPFAAVCLLATIAPTPFAFGSGPYDLRLEVSTTDKVPGLGEHQRLGYISDARINDAGDIVFVGSLTPSGEFVSRFGIFLKQGGVLRKVLADGDPLPDGSGTAALRYPNFPVSCLDQKGTVAILLWQGVLVWESSQLRWAIRIGAPVPGTSLTVRQFGGSLLSSSYLDPFPRPFFGEEGEIAFEAVLSDDSNAILLYTKTGLVPLVRKGAQVPGRPLTFENGHHMEQVRLSGSSVTFALTRSSPLGGGPRFGIFQYSEGSLRTVAVVGDPLLQGGTIKSIWELDANGNGNIAFAVDVEDASKKTSPQILTWSKSQGLKRLLDRGSVQDWASGPPSMLTVISLDDRDRLFFTAGSLISGGIYLNEGGILEKIVADGDPSPLGGTLTITPLTVDPMMGPSRVQYGATANGDREIAFLASNDQGKRWRPYLWSRGWLSPIGPASGEAETQTGRLIYQLHIKSLAGNSRLLVGGSLCCDESSALFSIVPAEPSITYIPFIALSHYDPDYGTYVDLVNHSPFPAFVTVEAFPDDDFPEQVVDHRFMFLEPGEASRSALYVPVSPGVRMGYLRITVEGGADVSAEASVELFESSKVISQTKIVDSGATRDAEIQIGQTGGGTAIAVSNPGNLNAQIQLELVDDLGHLIGVHPINCLPEQQVVFLLSDFFKELPPAFIGRVRLRSETPFLVAAMTLAGVRFAAVPVQEGLEHAAREWGYANVHPGYVRQVVTNHDGTVAYVTEEYRLRVVRDGQVYDPLADSPGVLRRYGSDPWILGFWNDEIVFIAAESPTAPELEVVSWKPGHLKKLFGRFTDLPDGTRISHSDGYVSAVTEAGLIMAAMEGAPGSAAVTALYLFDGMFHRLCTLPSLPGRTSTPSIETVTARNTDFAVVATYDDYHELWRFSQGLLTKVADSEMTLEGTNRIKSFGQVEMGPAGKVYFRVVLQNSEESETRMGLFQFDGHKIQKIALEGDALSGFPNFTFTRASNSDIPRFSVNANDKLVARTGLTLQSRPDFRTDCFLLMDTTTSQTAVIVPTMEDLEAEETVRLGEFTWTDQDRLFFASDRSATQSVELWENGTVTRVVDPTVPLGTSPEAALSFSHLPFRVYPPVVGEPLLGLSTFGPAPTGLYQAVADNYRAYIFPTVVRVGDGAIRYDSRFSIHNRSSRAARATLSLVDSGGIVRSRQEFDLSAAEFKGIDLAELGTFVGWGRLEVTGGEVIASESIRFDLNATTFSEVHVSPAIPSKTLHVSSGLSSQFIVSPGSERSVALTLVNPYNEQQEVTVELLGPGLQIKKQTHLLLPANGQRSGFLTELVGVAQAPDWIRIRSVWPIAATALSFVDGTMSFHPVRH